MSQTKTEQYWTMKDGTKIAVGDMSVDHLRNTLRMLIREDRILYQELLHLDCIDEINASFGAAEWWKE
jgi:hypothetical protein